MKRIGMLIALALVVGGAWATDVNAPAHLIDDRAADWPPGSPLRPWNTVIESGNLTTSQDYGTMWPLALFDSHPDSTINCLAHGIYARCWEGELYLRLWQWGWTTDGDIYVDSSAVITLDSDPTSSKREFDAKIVLTRVRAFAQTDSTKCQVVFW